MNKVSRHGERNQAGQYERVNLLSANTMLSSKTQTMSKWKQTELLRYISQLQSMTLDLETIGTLLSNLAVRIIDTEKCADT